MKQTIKPILGGLNTKMPPTLLKGDQSPDALNVVLRDGVLQKRGGFVPLFKDRMPGDCIENVAWRTRSALSDSGVAAEGDFIISPGHMVAGHRTIYEGMDSFAVSLWFSPTSLIPLHGGNGQSSGSADYNPAPFTTKILPIISKGPTHKFGFASPTTVDKQWGTHSNAGMPFCIYIFNSGSGAAPVWSFRISAHVLVAGSWTLQTATSTVPVEVGGRYHIIGAVTASGLGIRVARVRDGETPVYVENVSAPYAGTVAWNKCPIQVFDCPMRFVSDTATGSATQRPGLGMTTAASGGYWYAKIRPEGKVDDIAIWKSPASLDALQIQTKLQFASQIGLIGLWSMRGDAEDYVREETGRGNHMFFVPRGPVSCNADDGGKEGGSWFYNGTTSYALLDVDGPNWRSVAIPTSVAAMTRLVRDNMPHGIAVEFWVDSIEPETNQVIAEIHSVLRLEINQDGKLLGYCRDGDPAHPNPAVTAQAIGANYQGPLTSDIVLQAGRRYAVALVRIDGGTQLQMFIDGVLHKSSGALNPNNYQTVATTGNSHEPSGITLGMGSFERMIRATAPSTASSGIAETWQLNTDAASGFCGRIETFRIITTPNAGTLVTRHGPEDAENWRFPESRTFQNPRTAVPGDRKQLMPTDGEDTIRKDSRGSLPVIATQVSDGVPIASVNAVADPSEYTLSDTTKVTDIPTDVLGHDILSAVGARVYHTLAYYRFDSDDRDFDYKGAYLLSLEYRYHGGIFPGEFPGKQETNPFKHVHVQFSSVTDQVGLLGAAERRCAEADVLDETENTLFSLNPGFKSHRQKPYGFRSPAEFGCRWTTAMVPAAPGTTPVTLLADYDVQTQSRRLQIAACGRQLFWAKPAWDEGRLLFAGGLDSHVLALTDAVNDINVVGTATKTVIQFSCWLKPLRLDGLRMIAHKSNVGNIVNWMVYADNGAITVLGVEGTSFVWRFQEGSITGTPADVSRTTSLKVGVWNHLVVLIGPTDVKVWINGQSTALVNTNSLAVGVNKTSAWGSAASLLPSAELYIGGSKDGRSIYSLPDSAPILTLSIQSWFGYIADVAVRTSQDTTRWPTGADGYVPELGTHDAAALHTWPMDEGDGWLLANVADEDFPAEIRIREFYVIASGLRQEEGRHYRSVAFRDRLVVTNGAANPQRIEFRGFQVPTPFRVRRLGVAPPVPDYVELVATTTAGTTVTAGLYLVVVSFVTEDGLESDPVQVGEYNLASAAGSLHLQIRYLPRSPDPQVVARRIYLSATGGGTPVFNRDINDNDSSRADVQVYAASGLSPDAGNQLPAPRARHCAIAGSSLVLADLPEQPAGQNAVAFSSTSEISQFPVSSAAIIIDSEDGKPVIGIGHNLGQVFLGKRDSIFGLSVGAIVAATALDAALRLVQAGESIGGGTAAGGNLLYGSSERGVGVFNNSEVQYLSDFIEPTWRNVVDRSNPGLYGQHGAFLRAFSQYLISVRRKGQEFNDTILVFDLGAMCWLRWQGVAHAYMRVLQREQEQILAIGGTDGRILRLDDDVIIEGADDEENRYGPVTLEATGNLLGTSTAIDLPTANFPTALAGLQGVSVKITYNGGALEETRTIKANTGTRIEWDEPLPNWQSHTSFVIGAYPGYWTTPWFKEGFIASDQFLNRIAIETLPLPGDLQLDISGVMRADKAEQAWPSDEVRFETAQVPMATGYSERPPKPRSNRAGTYHRMRLGTYGQRDKFGLVGIAIDLATSTSEDKTGRTS